MHQRPQGALEVPLALLARRLLAHHLVEGEGVRRLPQPRCTPYHHTRRHIAGGRRVREVSGAEGAAGAIGAARAWAHQRSGKEER